jgi:hypothetical protein
MVTEVGGGSPGPLMLADPGTPLHTDLINAVGQMSDPGKGNAVSLAARDQRRKLRLIRISGSCLPC